MVVLLYIEKLVIEANPELYFRDKMVWNLNDKVSPTEFAQKLSKALNLAPGSSEMIKNQIIDQIIEHIEKHTYTARGRYLKDDRQAKGKDAVAGSQTEIKGNSINNDAVSIDSKDGGYKNKRGLINPSKMQMETRPGQPGQPVGHQRNTRNMSGSLVTLGPGYKLKYGSESGKTECKMCHKMIFIPETFCKYCSIPLGVTEHFPTMEAHQRMAINFVQYMQNNTDILDEFQLHYKVTDHSSSHHFPNSFHLFRLSKCFLDSFLCISGSSVTFRLPILLHSVSIQIQIESLLFRRLNGFS